MTDPWAMALDAMFNGPGSAAAVYEGPGGVRSDAIRVIPSRPDRAARLPGGVQVILATYLVDVRRSELAEPVEGGVFEIGADRFIVQGEPLGDVEGLTWSCWAEPE